MKAIRLNTNKTANSGNINEAIFGQVNSGAIEDKKKEKQNPFNNLIAHSIPITLSQFTMFERRGFKPELS